MPDGQAGTKATDTATGQDHLPLSGIVVLDLTLARAGPTCVRHLADWGAEIIRIEPPATGEDIAGARDGFDFQNLHRNKRAINLNLKDKQGLAAFMRLVARADVIVENMRAEVKHRLGVAWDDVRAVNPRIVYGSISGFGQTGPYGKRAGVDQIAQGMGGLMSITGEPGRGPMRVGIPMVDLTAGNLLALGIMMALFDRTRTGVGRWVTTSLLEAQVFMLDFQAARWLFDKRSCQAGRQRPSHRHPDRRVPGQRRPHQHRRQFGAAMGPLLRGDRAARLADPPWLAEPEGPQRRPRRHQCRDRRGDADEAGGPLDRTVRGRGYTLRPDQHDRQSVCGPTGAAPRHGSADAPP